LLGRSGLRISPLGLGTMTFGTEWGWGAEKDECRKIFDQYAELGGNFIDTANGYTNGHSEMLVGEFLSGRREQFVVATKYTANTRAGDPNAGGNHRKNLTHSLEASLRRLQTEVIDLYWVHMWDRRTPVEETMRALDDAVRQGKILYVGISDAPAWKVAQANTLASLRGWSPFVGLQVEYNLIQRTVERELVPMAIELGLGVVPWSPLAGGVLSGKYSEKDLEGAASGGGPGSGSRKDVIKNLGMLTPRALAIANEVKAVAREAGAKPTHVALHWLLRRPGVASPILGARTLEQLEDNLRCLDLWLSDEHLARLDGASRIELGFPHDFLASPMVRSAMDGGATIDG
jgi:aryl-alcohol dehydrogenase-like predicted oxidoreductase